MFLIDNDDVEKQLNTLNEWVVNIEELTAVKQNEMGGGALSPLITSTSVMGERVVIRCYSENGMFDEFIDVVEFDSRNSAIDAFLGIVNDDCTPIEVVVSNRQ